MPLNPPAMEVNVFQGVPGNVVITASCASLEIYRATFRDFIFFECTNDGSATGNSGGGDNGGGNGNGGDNGGNNGGNNGGGNPAGIETLAEAGISVSTLGRSILVSGADNMPVILYDNQGRPLATMHAAFGQTVRFDVPATGVYMVRVGNIKAQRVAVLR